MLVLFQKSRFRSRVWMCESSLANGSRRVKSVSLRRWVLVWLTPSFILPAVQVVGWSSAALLDHVAECLLDLVVLDSGCRASALYNFAEPHASLQLPNAGLLCLREKYISTLLKSLLLGVLCDLQINLILLDISILHCKDLLAFCTMYDS